MRNCILKVKTSGKQSGVVPGFDSSGNISQILGSCFSCMTASKTSVSMSAITGYLTLKTLGARTLLKTSHNCSIFKNSVDTPII